MIGVEAGSQIGTAKKVVVAPQSRATVAVPPRTWTTGSLSTMALKSVKFSLFNYCDSE